MPGVGYQAGGNITPKSIVQLATVAEPNNVGNTPATAGFQVILSSGVNTPMVGISGQSTRFIQIQNPPVSTSIGNPNDGFHAVSGENCLVFLIGQVAPLIASNRKMSNTIIAGIFSCKKTSYWALQLKEPF